MTTRTDDWENPAAGLGSIRDKAVGVAFGERQRLSRVELRTLYVQNPLAARINDKIVNDALRHGFTPKLEARDLSRVEKELDRLQFKRQLGRWAKWGRLYGGAVLCPITTHKRQPHGPENTPKEPLRVETVAKLLAFRAVDGYHARPLETDAGWCSPTFGQTLEYEIHGIVNKPTKVHHTRAFPFEAIELPIEEEAERPSSNGWNESILDRVFDDLSRDGATRAHAVSMMYVASLTYLKLHGYRDKYRTKEGKRELQKMLSDMRRDLDSRGILGLDEKDELGSITVQLAGTYELIDKARDALASATEYPREVLFNESPNGLRGGELSGAQALYHATVEAFQTEKLEPAILDCLRIVYAVLGIEAEPAIEWEALWVPDAREEAELAKLTAEADGIYFDKGATNAGELRTERLVKGKRGALQLDADAAAAPLDLAAEVAAAEQEAGLVSPETDAAGPSVEPPPNDLMTPQEAAALYKVPTRTITRRIATGELSHWGFHPHKRVSAAEVAALSRSHETPVAA